MVQPSTPLSEGVGTLEEYRTLAEHSAAAIKRMKDQISNAEYKHTERLYMEGKAAVDGWVTQMLIEVESGGHHAEMSQNQKRTLDAASVKVQTFLEFAGGLSSADMSRGLVDALACAIPNAIDKMVDAGIRLWREFRAMGTERRGALIARIKDVQWKSFNDIPSASVL